MCADWVHDRYTSSGGRSWPTWHPPRDPRYHCAFGHEHGSNPRAFPFFRRTGMPAFGPTARSPAATSPTPASRSSWSTRPQGAGLDGRPPPGSGSPRRGTVRFHSLEAWLFRRRGGRLLAHTRHMADFGGAVPNCPGARLRAEHAPAAHPGCESVYEEWDTALDVGGVFAATRASGSTTRSPSSTRALPSAWSSTSASPAARTIRRAGTRTARATSARCSTRAGWSATAAEPLSHRRVRPPRAGGPAAGGRLAGSGWTSRTSAAASRTRSSWSGPATAASTAPAAGSTRRTSSSPATACCARTNSAARARSRRR